MLLLDGFAEISGVLSSNSGHISSLVEILCNAGLAVALVFCIYKIAKGDSRGYDYLLYWFLALAFWGGVNLVV